MGRQLSTNLKTLTLRPALLDGDVLMGIYCAIGEDLQNRSLWEALEEHVLYGAKNPLHFDLLNDI
jgi:hypothetical protein